MITVKLREVRDIAEGLNDLLRASLPVKASYWIGKLAKKIRPKIQSLDQARIDLCKKYAQIDEKGDFVVKDHNYVLKEPEAFAKELEGLLETGFEIDFNPIPLSLFGNSDVTPTSLLALEKFIDGDK